VFFDNQDKKILPSVTVRMKFNCLENLRNLN
jgi:hypothetical protein